MVAACCPGDIANIDGYVDKLAPGRDFRAVFLNTNRYEEIRITLVCNRWANDKAINGADFLYRDQAVDVKTPPGKLLDLDGSRLWVYSRGSQGIASKVEKEGEIRNGDVGAQSTAYAGK